MSKDDGREWVWIPHLVLDQVRSGTDFGVFAIISRHRKWAEAERDDEAFPGRKRIQEGLGHPGRDPKTVTLSTNRLERIGLLTKRHDHRSSKSRVFYSLPPSKDQPYEELDRGLLGWMASNRLTPEQLMWFTRWQRACGREGWTTDSCWEMAQRCSGSQRTVERNRSELVRCGLLVNEHRPGKSSLTRTADLAELLSEDPWGDAPSAAWSAPANADADRWPMLTAAGAGL